MWAPLARDLMRDHTVIVPDLRGVGLSARPDTGYDKKTQGADMAGMLDALKIEKINWCGLSMGGMVGMWLGIHAPQRIDRLVLANTAAKIGTAEMWNARIDAVRKGGMPSIASAVLARWFSSQLLEAPTPIIARMRTTLEGVSTEGYTASCAAVRDMDQRHLVSRIRAPTLVIAGTEDFATPAEDGRFVAEHVPNAHYVELPAAHLSNVQAASAFTQALMQFLTGRME